MRASWIGTMVAVCGAAIAGTGCATVDTAAEEAVEVAAAQPDEDGEDAEAERRSMEHKLAVAERRLAHAQMEREMHELTSSFAVATAEHDLKHAEAALAQFTKMDMPNRIARSELSLARSKDSANEAAEELEQIMIMYKEQDLEDMTAEFVINRGKRNAERSKLSLGLQTREHDSLVNSELPREKDRLEMAVRKMKHALKKAQMNGRAGMLMKEISLMNAELEIEELRRKMEKLDEKVEG